MTSVWWWQCRDLEKLWHCVNRLSPSTSKDRKFHLFAARAEKLTRAEMGFGWKSYERNNSGYWRAYQAVSALQGARHGYLGQVVRNGAERTLCELLREVFENPFRQAPPLEVSQDALHLAEVINKEKRWKELPVLADALEDGRCTDLLLLNHLRNLTPCPKCGGVGMILAATGVWEDCSEVCMEHYPAGVGCAGSGWDESPVKHERGCWAIDRVLGRGLK